MLPWWRFTGRMVRALEMTMGQKASDDADDHCQPKLLGDRLVCLYLLYCKFIHFGHFSLLSGVPKSFWREFSEKFLNVTSGEKFRESLFTF